MRIERGPPLQVPDGTLASSFLALAARAPDAPGFLVRREGGPFETWSRGDVARRAREVAHGLLALGVRPGDSVGILADTRAEWALADYGALLAGGVTVTVYPTLTAEQALHILADARVRVLVVDTPAQVAKVAGVLDRAPDVARVVALAGAESAPPALASRFLAWDAFLALGRERARERPGEVDARVAALRPDDLSTIIYTSGTTGVPKGAMLSHRNWLAASRALTEFFEIHRYAERRSVIFLPLAHVLSRLQLVFTLENEGVVAFSAPSRLADDLREVRPTVTVCVPRIYERMHDQIRKTVAEGPAWKRGVFARAEAVAKAHGEATADGRRAPLALRARRALYERLVYRKLRERLGFDAVIGGLSTSAAIRPDLLAFFQGIGVRIVELWGMTELAGPGTTNLLDRYKPGTVGRPIPGAAVALAEDGEVLFSGPNVFLGYHARPEENAETFVEIGGERFVRTGDVGAFDEDGFLRIVDRKKEILVLDTGKKVAPIAVEETLKAASPFVMDACVVGTGARFAGALVQPNYDALVRWAQGRGVPFDEARVVVRPDPTGRPMTYAVGDDLLAHADVRALFEGEVAKANALLADFERVRAFRLLAHAFTMDRDELTPSLKKKRRVIEARYAREVREMLASPSPSAPPPSGPVAPRQPS